MKLSDLHDAKVKTVDGDMLGRVHDVHVKDGKLVALACGPGGLIERLTARPHGRVIPWGCVRKIQDGEVIVSPDAPKTSSSGSRNRQRTRQASARRSKR
jgi:sporulation protein YlmC with PRC-barrel domain